LLRKYTYFNYAYYRTTGGMFDQAVYIQKNHIGASRLPTEGIAGLIPTLAKYQAHCVEMIRQVLMCNGDTGLILYHWTEQEMNPYPDFNVWHSCRDPEEILALAKRREAPIVKRPSKTDGDIIMPTPP
jgi:hypothetical protein